MKRAFLLLPLCAALTVFSACGAPFERVAARFFDPPASASPVPEERPAPSSPVQSPAAPSTPNPTPTPAPARSGSLVRRRHSDAYLPGHSQAEVIAWFEEAVLSSEYTTNESQSRLVQKWTEPIVWSFSGEYTASDEAFLTEFFEQMNDVPGFPGFVRASDPDEAAMRLIWCEKEEFYAQMGESIHGEDATGAATYWYDLETNSICSALICYRNDALTDDVTRRSVLLEEIVNSIGLGNDSETRTDSIIYQYDSSATELSDVDWLIIRLLYGTPIRCGMDADACAEIIRQVYY